MRLALAFAAGVAVGAAVVVWLVGSDPKAAATAAAVVGEERRRRASEDLWGHPGVYDFDAELEALLRDAADGGTAT